MKNFLISITSGYRPGASQHGRCQPLVEETRMRAGMFEPRMSLAQTLTIWISGILQTQFAEDEFCDVVVKHCQVCLTVVLLCVRAHALGSTVDIVHPCLLRLLQHVRLGSMH